MRINHPIKINTSLDNYYLNPYKYNISIHNNILIKNAKGDDNNVNSAKNDNDLNNIIRILTSIIMSNDDKNNLNQCIGDDNNDNNDKTKNKIDNSSNSIDVATGILNPIKSNIIFKLIANNKINELTHIIKINNVDLNIQDNDGDTPLHIAIFLCNYKASKLLINNGAQLTIKDKWGQIALHRICFCIGENDLLKIIDLFEINNAKQIKISNIFDIVDNFGNTPFHLVLKYIIKNNLDIMDQHKKLINKLKNLTNLKIKNKEGKTPIDMLRILNV